MKVKPISYKTVKESLLADPEVKAYYLAEKKAEEAQALLQQMRERSGLTITQIAERMGVSQPAVSKLERNATKASLSTLQRYAQACGVQLTLGFSA